MGAPADEDLKAEAARILLGAVRRRAQLLSETPFGRMLRGCVSESQRIRIEEGRKATSSDFARHILSFIADEAPPTVPKAPPSSQGKPR